VQNTEGGKFRQFAEFPKSDNFKIGFKRKQNTPQYFGHTPTHLILYHLLRFEKK
jgi:hypothetical protein